MGPNAEALDRLYDRFWHHGDWRSGAGLMAPDIEWLGLDGDPTLAGERRGARGVNEFFSEWLDAWEVANVRWTIEELTEDLLLVRTSLHVKGRGSGMQIDSEIGQIWEFEGGLAVRQTMYRTYEDARAAADELVSSRGG